MFNNSSNSTFHHLKDLDPDTGFETYSDERLAAVYFDNARTFSFDLFQQVLDVVTDPQFKSNEVTFRNIWDILERASTYRRSMTLTRTAMKPPRDERTSGVIPPVILGLVVDTIVQQNAPLGSAAMEPYWRKALECNGTDLRNMALVHRSWTDIAQRGLRRRAIIPFKYIHIFLLSPLCGPWITEMIIYWTIREDDDGVVGEPTIKLLKALLETTPNVRSLAFNTALRWNQQLIDNGGEESLKVESCLDIISNALPDLRNLWLKHFTCDAFSDPMDYSDVGEPSLDHYDAFQTLCACMSKMCLLEFLSMEGWMPGEKPTDSLNWNEHPPSSLKTIELSLQDGPHDMEVLKWLLQPCGNFRLQSLSICGAEGYIGGDYQELAVFLQGCIHKLGNLSVSTKIIWNDVDESYIAGTLDACSGLTSLDIFYTGELEHICSVPGLPPSLEFFAIHCTKEIFRERAWSLGNFSQSLKERISSLPRLQSIHFILYSNYYQDSWSCICKGLDSRFYRKSGTLYGPASKHLPKDLTSFCQDRNIRLVCVKAEVLY